MDKKERMIEQEIDRRKFLRGLGLGIGGATLGIYGANGEAIKKTIEGPAMGVVVHSYWARWNSKTASDNYPSFTNALQLLRHC